ncbi:MAG: hypothetical protein IJT73_01340 [Selenomonadaceae bacterium]|nr:hypothetical protein [Selenomonadaceae bacterium]
MKKIILLGTKGAFAEMVAEKIRFAAEELKYPCEVFVLTFSDLQKLRAINPDVILFSPPRYRSFDLIQKICPNAVLEMMDMKEYAFMDGRSILNKVRLSLK